MYSTVEDSHLRYALRVYFIGGMFVLAIIGNQCCKCAAKLDLLKGKPVDLHRMTGWLHPKETIYCIWKLKRLPGGLWLGLMMIVASIVTIAADFATNSIKEVDTIGRCKFTTGLVMSLDAKSLMWGSPPDNSFPALRAGNTQDTSFRNGCQIGIYKKLPGVDDPMFCAGADDIYGTWDCNDMNRDQVFDPKVNQTDIVTSMLEEQIMVGNYEDVRWNSESTSDEYGFTTASTHLVMWSIYADDNAGSPYHVRVSIDLNTTLADAKTMKTFECNVTSKDDGYRKGINEVIGSIDGNMTLDNWAQGLNAKVFAGTGAGANPTPQLAGNVSQYLNAMTMVESGGNSILNTTLPGDVPLYGCIIRRTWLNPGVIFLACFTGLCLLVTTTYYITLLALLGRHGIPSCCVSRQKREGLNLDMVPSGTLSWMLHASRERGRLMEDATSLVDGVVPVPGHERELNDWSIVLVQDGQGTARLVRTDGYVRAAGSQAQSVERIPLSMDRKDVAHLQNIPESIRYA